MDRITTETGRRDGERGQVLILAVVALILVIIATLLLFDIQTALRGKIKGQNAADAAALTAAEWQKHSLNLIGELNLVRATGTLISDPFFANGILNAPADQTNAAEFFADLPQPITQEEFTLFPEKAEFYDANGNVLVEKLIAEVVRVEKQKRYLDNLNDLVSQLQTRISFVGPLLAFGAAQQAAKNNGVNYDRDCSEFFIEYMNIVGTSNVYQNFVPVFVQDYAWRTPYVYMLNSILDYSTIQNAYTDRTETAAYGIAAGTRFKFVGMPTLITNPPTEYAEYLGEKKTYDMIHGRDWCGLDKLLRLDFSGNWWGGFDCDYDVHFSNQSEILPLHIEFTDSTEPYESATDVGSGDGSTSSVNVLEHFTRNGEKLISETYNREIPYEYTVSDDVVKREEQQERKRTFYTLTNISITLDRPLETYNDDDADRRYDLLPRLSWAIFDGDWAAYTDEAREEWNKYLYSDFRKGNDYSSGARAYFEVRQDTVTISGSMGRPRTGMRAPDVGQVFASSDTNGEAQRVSNALNSLDNNSITRIEATAAAKPVGQIEFNGRTIRPFEAGRMVLPVFRETALMPIALEPVDGFSMGDIDWFYYLTEFIPILAGSSSPEEAWRLASQHYPNHLRHYAYYYAALLMLGNPNFRQAGISWLDTVAVWGKDQDGNRYPIYTNRDVNCSHRSGGGGGGWGGTNISRGGPSSLH